MEAHDQHNFHKEKIITRYSDRLILRVIAYFKNLDDGELTTEEAEMYLDSLADLGHVMKRSILFPSKPIKIDNPLTIYDNAFRGKNRMGGFAALCALSKAHPPVQGPLDVHLLVGIGILLLIEVIALRWAFRRFSLMSV